MFVLNGNQEKVVEALRRCGLTAWEGKVMFTLQMTDETTPLNLSSKSGVSQSKIYNVIYRMAERGIVRITNSEPMRVRAMPIEIYLDRLQKSRQRQMAKDAREICRVIKKLKPCFVKPYERHMRIFAPKYNGR